MFILLRSVHIITQCSYYYGVFISLLGVCIITVCLYFYWLFILLWSVHNHSVRIRMLSLVPFNVLHFSIFFSALINLMSSERSEREPFAETLI